MLKKMRWRFIASAIVAITAVVAVLVGGMNLWNYHLTTQRQDDVLRMLMESGKTPPQPREPDAARKDGAQRQERAGEGEFTMPGPFGGHFPEFRYSLRFFSVRCDGEGRALETDQENIASVSAEEAAAWAETVVSSGKTSGYLNGYRYLSRPSQEGTAVFFLNSEREIQSLRTMLLVSCVVAAAALLAVFLLVALFSKRAIAPYIRNIETQKRFITDAGHELKTPLTAISASADLLAIDAPDNEWVSAIQTECARMTRLVSDLVTLSRLDEEQPFPERADFSLSDAVWEIAEPMQSVARAKGKRYEQSIADGLTVRGDRASIQQMVSILLDNAIKYSGDHGAIRLTLSREKGRCRLEVFNTCSGDALPDLSRLFERFYRPDASRSSHTGGTGIGLSIAKAVAERHGGAITAEAGNGGITFTVWLETGKDLPER